jgi:hypothetical protein
MVTACPGSIGEDLPRRAVDRGLKLVVTILPGAPQKK